MPAHERARLEHMIRNETWASANLAELDRGAAQGNGYFAAFLYALRGQPNHAIQAERWLLGKFGRNAYWTRMYAERMSGNFFSGGQGNIAEVYYDTDMTGILAFDWAFAGLTPNGRREIEDGLLLFARYRMRAMDVWTQTSNLVFKPTTMVAMVGLATGNPELLNWGFKRTHKWGNALGGYDLALNAMLKDGGPWAEAPIYPVAHQTLLMAAQLSRWRGLRDGKDWFASPLPGGGSGKGLLDYFIDTAYPIERTAAGEQIRIASFGDGATNPAGDFFLVKPAAGQGDVILHDALIAAANVAQDQRYRAFIAMIPGYQPNLIDRPSLPPQRELPPAPSRIWPDFGYAMLRSDELPRYWDSGKAIAVSQIMSQGYGHDHRDKFSITLHAGGRLIYPDYNAIQYENPSIGWTRNSVSHNTLIVDEKESGDAPLTGLRHEFTPDVKFLAASSSGVFAGVDQTRILLLAKDYLLDLFHASSPTPHTYDYVLHSFGSASPVAPRSFTPTDALHRRYWLIDNQQGVTTSDLWSIDLGGQGRGETRLRMTMAGARETLVVHGNWGAELSRLVAERKQKLDELTMLAVRRRDVRDTLFAAAHEPFGPDTQPVIERVVVLASTESAALVRVEAKGFTDIVAVALGPDNEGREHSLTATPASAGALAGPVAFRSYGYLRVTPDGRVTARGGWTALTLKSLTGPLVLNGQVIPAAVTATGVSFGRPPPVAVQQEQARAAPELPLQLTISPRQIAVDGRDRRQIAVELQNPTNTAISGVLRFELLPGLSFEPSEVPIQPLAPGGRARRTTTIVALDPKHGRNVIPYRMQYRIPGQTPDTLSTALPLPVLVGPTLESVYVHPAPYYDVRTVRYVVRADMQNGLHRFLADASDIIRLDGTPLFTLSDGKTDLVTEQRVNSFTWPIATPASLTAMSLDRVRWRALYLPNRIVFNLDGSWTQVPVVHVAIPGNWASPSGPPRWRRVVVAEVNGRLSEGTPGAAVRLAGAELEFPDGGSSLAVKFEPPQLVSFEGTGLRFTLTAATNDGWHIGFCRPGEFDAWLGK